jgi:hypothetical protein
VASVQIMCRPTLRGIPMMPWHMLVQPLAAAARLLTFPTPLMTPPDTSTYFMAACSGRGAVGEGEGREVELTAGENFVRSAPPFSSLGPRAR